CRVQILSQLSRSTATFASSKIAVQRLGNGGVPATMQDDFVALFAYDRWANRKVLDACRKLTAEQYVAEPVPGWSSVRSTVYHIALVTDFHCSRSREFYDTLCSIMCARTCTTANV